MTATHETLARPASLSNAATADRSGSARIVPSRAMGGGLNA